MTRAASLAISTAVGSAAVLISLYFIRSPGSQAGPGEGGETPIASRLSSIQDPYPAPPMASLSGRGAPPVADDPSLVMLPAADRFGAPENSAVEDISQLIELLTEYRILVKGALFPTGGNDDVAATLLGKNTQSLAFLPATHRSINSQGELTDPWDTPYIFHPVSSESLEIRSAGPDRSIYTEDDIVLSTDG